MREKTAELAVVSNKTFAATTAVNLNHYDISSALQTTLELDELISIFCSKIQGVVPHNGVEYTHFEFATHFKRGMAARHSCNYGLEVEDQHLGELKLMRSYPFGRDELRMLESLLCCLIYPLRNGILLKQALKMAYTDSLTKANNRVAFNDTLQREMLRAQRASQSLALVFVDVDHFKAINDSYGHDAGDKVLVSVAQCLMNSVRGSDAVFRYGGEEFVVMLTDTDHAGAQVLAERLRADIEAHTMMFDMQAVTITASLGVSWLTPFDSVESLIKRADVAMYQAKRNGRNRVCFA